MKRPMLAARLDNLSQIQYPVYASRKLDGVRALVSGGKVYSRTLKLIPSSYVQEAYGKLGFEGYDGELICGSPTAPDAYRRTQSATSTIGSAIAVDYYVFDIVKEGSFEDRLNSIFPVDRLDHTLVTSEAELLLLEEEVLNLGYEGLILRSPYAPYKHNRSTIREQGMMKLKRFTDGEAEVIEAVELMRNKNEATLDERGYTKRSHSQLGKEASGIMGALRVRDLTTGVEFEIGTGFTQADREAEWKEGTIVKYKHFTVGVKDKPRFPVYLGRREDWDLG